MKTAFLTLGTALGLGALGAAPALADIVHGENVIINGIGGSLCVGVDCLEGEVFDFDTVRLKENNIRIKFDDTSATGSFPFNDWQLTANENGNGGRNMFAIEDVTNARIPFTVEANARTNALYVDANGRIGMGTMNPAMRMHMVDGNTPTLRLDQETSSGFAAQVWDVAGNEANFFIRDVTGSGTLPFRIQTGAQDQTMMIGRNGKVAIGATSYSTAANLEVSSAESYTFLRLGARAASPNTYADMTYTDGGADGSFRINIGDADAQELELNDDGNLTLISSESFNTFRLQANGASPNTFADMTFTDAGADGEFRINIDTVDGPELKLDTAGVLTVTGGFKVNATSLNVPDYVFATDYELRPLTEVRAFIDANSHLPDVPSAAEIDTAGLDLGDMQLRLLRKVEELTLYTLQQDETIARLEERLRTLEN